MLKYLIIGLQVLFLQSIQTDREVRQCISQTASKGGSCFELFSFCFQNQLCANEFNDLFDACNIPDDNEPYDPSCIRTQYFKSSGQTLKNFIQCLSRSCAIIGDQIEEQELNEQVNQQAQTDLKTCIAESLVNAGKCWLPTNECDDDCLKGLDSIENCKTQIESNQIDKAKVCIQLQSIINPIAQEIRNCLLNNCFQITQKIEL